MYVVHITAKPSVMRTQWCAFFAADMLGPESAFYKHVNVQQLQQRVLTDANRTTLQKAMLCYACHYKNQVASIGQASDGALDNAAHAEEEAANGLLEEGDVDGFAKATVVSTLLNKLQNNEAVLLSDLFHDYNEILKKNGKEECTQSSYLLQHITSELEDSVCRGSLHER